MKIRTKMFLRSAVGFLLWYSCTALAQGTDFKPSHRREVTRYPNDTASREMVYEGGVVVRDTRFFQTGAKEMQTEYRDGKEDGLFTVWYGTGQVMTQAHFADGKRHGAWLQWHPNGMKSFEAHYTNGLAHGLYASWYSTGQKERETVFDMDVDSGPSTTWDRKGVVIAKGTNRNGEPWEGTFEFYRDKVYRYREGKVVATNVIENYLSRCIEPPFNGHLLEMRADGTLLLDKKHTTLDTLIGDMGSRFIPAETSIVLMAPPTVSPDAVEQVKTRVIKYPCSIMIGTGEQNQGVQPTN
jgi:MORN repeat variant